MTTLVVDLAGWMGAGALLAAYALVSSGGVTGRGLVFQLLNLLGAVGLLVNGAYHGAWPSAGLNATWLVIGVATLARLRPEPVRPARIRVGDRRHGHDMGRHVVTAGDGRVLGGPEGQPAPRIGTASNTTARAACHGIQQEARRTSWRRFTGHYLLMVLVMYAAMLVLNPVYAAVASRAGYADPWGELPVISTLVMAANMTVPMLLLTLRHGHGRRAMVEMAASMVVPTLTAAGLHALGVLPAGQLMTVAHLGMFPAMLLVMLRRYQEYAT